MKTKNEQRSRTMRAVRSKDTTPELTVRHVVHRLGYRFRLHRKSLPGKPDLAFIGRRKVIFVNGCFWHGHKCARGARMPKTNAVYWRAKIAGNMARDARHLADLKAADWRALVIWECEIKNTNRLAERLRRFLK